MLVRWSVALALACSLAACGHDGPSGPAGQPDVVFGDGGPEADSDSGADSARQDAARHDAGGRGDSDATAPDDARHDGAEGSDSDSDTARRDAARHDGSGEGDADADAGPELPVPPDPTPADLSALATLQAQALAAPSLAGHTFGGLIADADTGAVIWADAPDDALIPASNTKVFTTAAALGLLGEEHQMLSRVFADAPIGPDGTLTGDLYLHGEHDFTWSHWFYPDPRYPLDVLADRLWDAGLRTVTGDLEIYGAYCYEAHHFGSYSPAAHRDKVEAAFAAALADRGITVQGTTADHATMALPPGQVELARWESIPLGVAIWAINRKSHNEMADVLCRHVGYLAGGSSDYATGGATVAQWLADVGIDTTGLELFDGSGLDTDNRVSARHLVELYQTMLTRPEGPAWLASLSVAGAGGPGSTDANDVAIVLDNSGPYNGTLAFRMTGDDTAGRVFGKSGTNAGITTSGLLLHRHDGRRYAFAFLMNAISSGQYSAARAAQDQLVANVAADYWDAGPLPEPPVVQVARGGPGGVELTWQPSPGAAGYLVERSDDGRVFAPDDAVYTLDLSYTDALAPPATRYYRVTAVGPAGFSGEPSDLVAARVDFPAARVLLVDADDRWEDQPTDENPRGGSHAFLERYAAAIGDVPFDSAANEAVTGGLVDLADYDAVFWAAGEDSATHESFSAAEQALVAAYVAGGGQLFASGAEIAWDLADHSGVTAADEAFLADTLHASYVADDAEVYVYAGAPGSIFAELAHGGFWTPGGMFVAWPDVLAPAGGATTALQYPSGGAAAVQFEGVGRVILAGFPFEAVDAAETRAVMMDAVLGWFEL